MSEENSHHERVTQDPGAEALIKMAVQHSTRNIVSIIDSKLEKFASRFSGENFSIVESACKKVRREKYACKRKATSSSLTTA